MRCSTSVGVGSVVVYLYTARVQGIVKRHSVDYQQFADDLQLYTSCRPHVPGDLECSVMRHGDCIGEVKYWMIKHKLILNENKTEFLVVLSPHNLKKYGLPEYLVVGGVNIEPVVSVGNLGAYLDIHMSMKQHVNAVCRKCNYHLIRSIRIYFTKHVCHSLVIALVVSSLDYCNALVLDLPEYQLKCLQNMHNRAARLVVLTPVSSHIKPVIDQLTTHCA